MDYAMSAGGLLVHSRKDWPCAVCRSHDISESRGYCLCVACARGVLAAAGAGVEGARDLLDDLTEALVLLEGRAPMTRLVAN